MKYLKTYESRSLFGTQEDKIEDLCDGRLAYLMDLGYEVKYHVGEQEYFNRDFNIYISLFADSSTNSFNRLGKSYKKFSWSDIKDYVIPLLGDLNKDFNVEVEIFDGNFDDKRHHTIDWVINDGPSRWFAPDTIKWVKIKIKRYLLKKDAKL
jgi:hypothetical protein